MRNEVRCYECRDFRKPVEQRRCENCINAYHPNERNVSMHNPNIERSLKRIWLGMGIFILVMAVWVNI